MKEISSMDFPQHDEVFYFYGQALHSSRWMEELDGPAVGALGVRSRKLSNVLKGQS
jgi:hypothetical protein